LLVETKIDYLDDVEEIFHSRDGAISWIQARLEDAVEVHRFAQDIERPKITTNFNIIDFEQAPPHKNDGIPHVSRYASARDIDRMFETFRWLELLPASTPKEKRMKQTIVFTRSYTKGDQNLGWRQVARAAGVSHSKCKYVYDDCLADILQILFNTTKRKENDRK